jgi:ABC-type transport system, involved in lipoprotein release, permease component
MRGLFAYAVKDMKQRRKSELLIFISLTVMLFCIFNFTFLSRGMEISNTEINSNDYHILLGHLSEYDISIIDSLDFVKSVRTEEIGKVTHCYILLTDDNPNTLAKYRDKILEAIDAWNIIPFYHARLDYFTQRGYRDDFLNIRYLHGASDPVTTYIFIYVLCMSVTSAIPIAMTVNIKVRQKIEEFAVLKSVGMRNRHIIMVNLFQLIICFTAAFVVALTLSGVLMKVFSEVTVKMFAGNHNNLVRYIKVSWTDLLVLFAGLLSCISLVVSAICTRNLNYTIVEMINGVRISTVPFVKKTSKMFVKYVGGDETDDVNVRKSGIASYGLLYQIRQRRTLFTRFFALALLIVMPMFHLLVSALMIDHLIIPIDRGYERGNYTITANYTGFVEVNIPPSAVESIEAIEGVERTENRVIQEDGNVTQIDVYITPGMEDDTSAEIDVYVRDCGLVGRNVFENDKASAKFSILNSIFFLTQGTLIIISNLFVVHIFYYNYLDTRDGEMYYLRSMGVTRTDLARLLFYDMIWAVPIVAGSIPIALLVMSLNYAEEGLPSMNKIINAICTVVLLAVYVAIFARIISRKLKEITATQIAYGLARKD